ncbi:MAG TPA: glutamine--fructose-6-phosphate transaminase (isomerizing), partial [Planctomycetota bacterium]|nr:glutamine--fructose-6-phosphate transaminase (isomerizing) [Planctomycetota bacterium]
MCGIVGYAGRRQALDILMEGLRRLEYRGYDSAGVVVQNGHGFAWEKRPGNIEALEAGVRRRSLPGRVGLGHTRWATHGGITTLNAHPHFSCDRRLAVVHNGIIENHEELRRELESNHKFVSATDTEVIPHLIEQLYSETGGDILRAVGLAIDRLRGAFAIGVIHSDHPTCISVARVNCPMVLGLGDGENFMASDIPALLPYTRRILPLEEREIASIAPDGIRLFDPHLKPKTRRPLHVTWQAEAAVKDGHPHSMLQEIHDQARILEEEVKTLAENPPEFHRPKDIHRVMVVGCGTAFNAGLVAKIAIEDFARVPAEVELASELRHADRPVDAGTLVIAISQSGETADTIASARAAREAGSSVMAITNVRGSTLTREADHTLYMHAGPEVAVAATKTYTSQLMNVIFLALHLGRARHALARERFDELVEGARLIPGHVKRILDRDTLVRHCARKYQEGHGFMFIGRRYNLATACEAALKMKEITYQPAEGLGAGEMKHGPLALVDDRTVCVAVAP